MVRVGIAGIFLSVSMSIGGAHAQDAPTEAQMTIGNGEANVIEMSGLTRIEGQSQYSLARVNGDDVSAFRGSSTALQFSEVTIEKPGWIVLHPVINGRPDGDMVSGFQYVSAGTTENVAIQVDHPADPGDQFLVMLHSDVDEDRVFDFVFVEDGINVEDRAVFEGNRMIAHVFAVPE